MQILGITLDNASNNNKMITHLAEILPEFEGTFHHTCCFAHVNQIVARSFVGQFDVKPVKPEDIDTLMDVDAHALAALAESIEEEEQETRRARQLGEGEQGSEGSEDDGGDGEMQGESGKDDETEWLDEIATLTDEEREEFEAKVRPVKMALVKVSTRAFPSIRMFAHLWASNRFARSPSRS